MLLGHFYLALGRTLSYCHYTTKRSIYERKIDKLIIGNWAGDIIVGKERKTRIITYLDVASGYLMPKLAPAVADSVSAHTKKVISKLSCQTITYDNESEFALPQMIQKILVLRYIC